MTSPKAHIEPRTPTACERCRRRKTKCNGIRPQCQNCLKGKARCTWPKIAAPGSYYAITSPEEPPRISQSKPHTRLAIPDLHSLAKIHIRFPEAHLLQRLLEIFYQRHHDVELCSFLHKPSLNFTTLGDRSPFLVASIISLSALYLSPQEAKEDYGFETFHAMSDYYSQLAKFYASALCYEPSIPTIQALLILGIRELITWSNKTAFMLVGIAVRMRQALNICLQVSQQCSPPLKEIRRRTFWATIVVDRLVSYTCNQPFTSCTYPASIPLPIIEDAFSLEENYDGPTIEDLVLHTGQLSRVGVMPFFIAMVGLWGDMASLHTSGGRRRSKHGPHDPDAEFTIYKKAIDDFASSLPRPLTWSIEGYKLHQVTGQEQEYINLNFLLYHSRCIMHQEYLPQLDSQYSLLPGTDDPTVYDAAGISLDLIDSSIIKPCILAVNTITDIAVTLANGSDHDRQLLQSTFAANAILTASAVHLWTLYTQTCDSCPKHIALANAEKLRQIIKSWQPQWRVATALVETLEMLYKLYVYSYGRVVESDLDCWDMGADEINDDVEALNHNDGQLALADGDGLPNAPAIYQRLHDKIKSILVNPLLATDVKKRNMRTYCRTLWQHMWIPGLREGFGDDFMNLQETMGEPSLTLFGLSNLDDNTATS